MLLQRTLSWFPRSETGEAGALYRTMSASLPLVHYHWASESTPTPSGFLREPPCRGHSQERNGEDCGVTPSHAFCRAPSRPFPAIDATCLSVAIGTAFSGGLKGARLIIEEQPIELRVEVGSTGWFDERVLYLAPTPALPFVSMTEKLMEVHPSISPYGGKFANVIPHLTLGEDVPSAQRPTPRPHRLTFT